MIFSAKCFPLQGKGTHGASAGCCKPLRPSRLRKVSRTDANAWKRFSFWNELIPSKRAAFVGSPCARPGSADAVALFVKRMASRF